MARIKHRTAKLTVPQQLAFLQDHVPGRIRSIQSALGQRTYRELAAAAIFSRAIANFLGIGTQSGRLCADRKYFQHADGHSWEVKIEDVGGQFVDLDTLSSADKSALEDGINETDRAFAHLTFWGDSSSQTDSGLASDEYIESQAQRIRLFCDTVIRLFHDHASRANPA
jgi:hypothetical protein